MASRWYVCVSHHDKHVDYFRLSCSLVGRGYYGIFSKINEIYWTRMMDHGNSTSVVVGWLQFRPQEDVDPVEYPQLGPSRRLWFSFLEFEILI